MRIDLEEAHKKHKDLRDILLIHCGAIKLSELVDMFPYDVCCLFSCLLVKVSVLFVTPLNDFLCEQNLTVPRHLGFPCALMAGWVDL